MAPKGKSQRLNACLSSRAFRDAANTTAPKGAVVNQAAPRNCHSDQKSLDQPRPVSRADGQVGTTSLIATVQATDAIYFGIWAAARDDIANVCLVALPTALISTSSARLASITLAGRTEAPAMALFRRFVAKHLRDSPV